MTTTLTIYDRLAELLAYPREDYGTTLEECQRLLGAEFPEAASYLERFAHELSGKSPEDLEELYTHTFDLNPVSSLEIGWHLFGENYNRGEFLVFMRQAMRRLGLEESAELPDHLTHVLPTLARLDAREADRFLRTYLLPALQKVQAGLGSKDSPYQYLLEAIRGVATSPLGAILEGVES